MPAWLKLILCPSILVCGESIVSCYFCCYGIRQNNFFFFFFCSNWSIFGRGRHYHWLCSLVVNNKNNCEEQTYPCSVYHVLGCLVEISSPLVLHLYLSIIIPGNQLNKFSIVAQPPHLPDKTSTHADMYCRRALCTHAAHQQVPCPQI